MGNIEQEGKMASGLSVPAMPAPRKKAHAWLQVLLTGVLLYALAFVFFVLSGNPNLFPTVMMIGSFLVPITYVTFIYERSHLTDITPFTATISFVYGGILGVLAASLLEPIFIRHMDPVSTLEIGLIEEFAKIMGVLLIARNRKHDEEIDGLILGAAAGMGFAALESSGYTFTAFLSSQGSLSLLVGVTLMRGVLSPLGHGTWTAILASVLFREAKNGHFRFTLKVIGAYLLVAVLHAMWDGLPTVIGTYLGTGLDIFIGQVTIGIVGLVILWTRWRDAVKQQQAQANLAPAPAGAMALTTTAPVPPVPTTPADAADLAATEAPLPGPTDKTP